MWAEIQWLIQGLWVEQLRLHLSLKPKPQFWDVLCNMLVFMCWPVWEAMTMKIHGLLKISLTERSPSIPSSILRLEFTNLWNLMAPVPHDLCEVSLILQTMSVLFVPFRNFCDCLKESRSCHATLFCDFCRPFVGSFCLFSYPNQSKQTVFVVKVCKGKI